MSKEKNKIAAEAVKEETTEKKTVKIYPDIAYNKAQRWKSLVYTLLLAVLMGGMGLTIFIQGLKTPDGNSLGYISGAVMLVFLVVIISTLPSTFKQYPVKGDPIIEFDSKEITINGEKKKLSEVLEMRLTITLEQVGNKEANEKYVDSILSAEPPKHVTGNLDFAVKHFGKKGESSKTLYTTVADSYEALVALFSAGVKHYSIVYSLKKISKVSTYNLGETTTEDGAKLSDLSKKDRMKQLY